MAIENVRVPVEDAERNPVLKDMSQKGYTLVAVTDDGWNRSGLVDFHYWSLYFTKVIPKRQFDPCCERDYDSDGNCSVHSAPGVFRNNAFNTGEKP